MSPPGRGRSKFFLCSSAIEACSLLITASSSRARDLVLEKLIHALQGKLQEVFWGRGCHQANRAPTEKAQSPPWGPSLGQHA